MVAVLRTKWRPSVTSSSSQRAVRARRAWEWPKTRTSPSYGGDPGVDAVQAGGDLGGGFAVGYRVGPDRPAGHGLADLRGGDALVVAVVPLDQVVVDLGVREAGEFGRPPGSLPGLSQHQVELLPGQPLLQRRRDRSPVRGQRQVGRRTCAGPTCSTRSRRAGSANSWSSRRSVCGHASIVADRDRIGADRPRGLDRCTRDRAGSETVSASTLRPPHRSRHVASGPTGRPATIYDVAALAKLSIATVSRVLQGTGPVSAKARARVDQAAHELNYVPLRAARSLAVQRHEAHGLVLPDLAGPFYGDLLMGYERWAGEHGQSVVITVTHGNPDPRRSAPRPGRPGRRDRCPRQRSGPADDPGPAQGAECRWC